MTDPAGTARAWRSTSAGPQWGLRTLGALFGVVPLRLAYVLTWPFVLGWFLHWNHPRTAVVLAMRRLGRPFPQLAALRLYQNFAASLVDRHFLLSGRGTVTYDLPDAATGPRLRAAVLEPTPLVFLGSHLGTLELGAGAIRARGREVQAVAVPDPGSGALLAGVGDPSRDVGKGAPTIVADGSMESGLRMLRAIREGTALCLKGDRPLPGARPDQVQVVPFLGEDVAFPRGPVELARAAKARIVVLSVVRRGPLKYGVLVDVLPRVEDARDALRQYAEALGRHARAAPYDWFNFYPFWPADRPLVEQLWPTVPTALRTLGPALALGLPVGLLSALWGGRPQALLSIPLLSLATLILASSVSAQPAALRSHVLGLLHLVVLAHVGDPPDPSLLLGVPALAVLLAVALLPVRRGANSGPHLTGPAPALHSAPFGAAAPSSGGPA